MTQDEFWGRLCWGNNDDDDYDAYDDAMYDYYTGINNEPDIYVNEEKKTVTVVEHAHEYDGILAILKRYPFVDMDWLIERKRYHIPDTVVGVAKCHPEDEFDYDTGVKIAFEKVNRKIKDRNERSVKKFENELDKLGYFTAKK